MISQSREAVRMNMNYRNDRKAPLVVTAALLVVYGLAGCTSEVDQSAELEIEQALYFDDPASGAVTIVKPGTYTVAQAGDDTISLRSVAADEIVVGAQRGQHAEEIDVPLMFAEQTGDDEVHLVVMLSGGAALDATASYSGVVGRGRAIRRPVMTQQMLSSARMRYTTPQTYKQRRRIQSAAQAARTQSSRPPASQQGKAQQQSRESSIQALQSQLPAGVRMAAQRMPRFTQRPANVPEPDPDLVSMSYPLVTDINPGDEVNAGASLVLSGSFEFPAGVRVMAGSLWLPVASFTNDRVIVRVPVDAPDVTGPLTVGYGYEHNTYTLRSAYKVIAAPRIDSVTPSVFGPGDIITIRGERLERNGFGRIADTAVEGVTGEGNFLHQIIQFYDGWASDDGTEVRLRVGHRKGKSIHECNGFCIDFQTLPYASQTPIQGSLWTTALLWSGGYPKTYTAQSQPVTWRIDPAAMDDFHVESIGSFRYVNSLATGSSGYVYPQINIIGQGIFPGQAFNEPLYPLFTKAYVNGNLNRIHTRLIDPDRPDGGAIHAGMPAPTGVTSYNIRIEPNDIQAQRAPNAAATSNPHVPNTPFESTFTLVPKPVIADAVRELNLNGSTLLVGSHLLPPDSIPGIEYSLMISSIFEIEVLQHTNESILFNAQVKQGYSAPNSVMLILRGPTETGYSQKLAEVRMTVVQ